MSDQMQHKGLSDNNITRHHNPIISWSQTENPLNDQVWSQTKLGHKYKELSTKVHLLKLQVNSILEALKHWNWVCASPTTHILLQKELPIHYVASRFNLHYGMENPIIHLYNCHQLMILVDNCEGLPFRVSPINLWWPTFIWFY